MSKQVHVFINQTPAEDGSPLVGIAFVGSSIVEYQGDLRPAMLMDPDEARNIGIALIETAGKADEENEREGESDDTLDERN